MWLILFLILTIMMISGAFYVSKRMLRFSVVKKIYNKNKALGVAASLSPVIITLPTLTVSAFTPMVIILHLIAAFLLSDLIRFIVQKIAKKRFGYDVQIICALAATVIYLSFGWYNAHNVVITKYGIQTEKQLPQSKLRVVEIADLHLGITLDGKEFSKQMERVSETEPDIVVIVGDFADDDTKKDDLVTACKALGELKTRSGVYFVYGNHDKGYYDSRDFTAAELERELEANGVVILEDESVLIDNGYYIVGRKDRSDASRKSASELTSELDGDKYIIMLDHQPNDYDAESKCGADLVLSGHTHGGHVIPAGQIGLLIGANDRVYGKETRNGTTFIVTSGISGWGIPFKTGTVSEIVIVDIETKTK